MNELGSKYEKKGKVWWKGVVIPRENILHRGACAGMMIFFSFARQCTIVEVEEILEVGEIPPDQVDIDPPPENILGTFRHQVARLKKYR